MGSRSSIIDLSQRFGPADVYAAELRSAAGVEPAAPSARQHRVRDGVAGMRSTLVARTLAATVPLRSSAPWKGAVAFVVSVRPLWWVLRGWVLYTVTRRDAAGPAAPVREGAGRRDCRTERTGTRSRPGRDGGALTRAYGGGMPTEFFALRFHPFVAAVLAAIGMGPARSGVWVGADSVRVAMGWAFNATVPRASIRSILPDDAPVIGWGVTGLGGTRLVNGSSSGVVRLVLEPAVRTRVMGFGVQVTTLRISMDAPADLLASLMPA